MATSSNVSLKLLVDKKSNKVLFAEASKEFVDFLFYILSLPAGTIVSLLTKEGMVGCLGNLYESIENLNANYMQPHITKECILKPEIVNTNHVNVNLLTLPNVESSSTPKNIYRCSYNSYSDCRMYVANDPSAKCPRCNNTMTSVATLVALPAESNNNTNPGGSSGGYVKEVVTYTVMDNLEVKPMSTISSITLLSTFNVRDIGDLQEKEINFGLDEAVKLIKASLESKTVLTDVFLGNA